MADYSFNNDVFSRCEVLPLPSSTASIFNLRCWR
jgi:hypothetical protein